MWRFGRRWASALSLVLQVAGASQTVTVESGGDLIENDSTFHTDVDRDLFTKVPLKSQSSGLSSLVTQTTPGVSADSNGLFHGLGDHASNSFSVDGQSITDQQSKVFSNQLPSNSIQSIEVISGAPPAEYGGKTSLVIVATTRSGQGVTKPTGSIYGSYGSFGSAEGGVDLSYGGKNWGNFIEADGLNTGRFLDPPEFTVFHDKGNEENVFDRIDYSLTPADSIHLDLNYSRSWFQTPNSYRQPERAERADHWPESGTSASPIFGSVGNADQRSKIGTYQHFAHLHADHQRQFGLQPGRFCPQRRLRLLSQRQSARRSGPLESANLIHLPVPHAHQHWAPRGLFLREGNSQPQGRRAIRADFPARARQASALSTPPTTRRASTPTATRCRATPVQRRLRRRNVVPKCQLSPGSGALRPHPRRRLLSTSGTPT